jgi:hypothetical protein
MTETPNKVDNILEDNSVVIELTKIGPDGNAYAIVRENHEWYIKKTTKKTKIVAEDFEYIVGLMNKKDEAYSSYAKAIKHLNLKFKSLAEVYNFTGEINIFENDNLLSEDIAGFAEMKGMGFSGEGNLDGNKPLYEEEEEEESPEFEAGEDISTISMGNPTLWLVETLDNRLFLKPVGEDNSETNMTVLTNKRVYHFELVAK